MKRNSKLLVLLLSFALVFSLVALIVAADDEPSFDLAAAVAEVEAGSTVTLTGNASVTEAITVDKNLTIDLGGYTVSSTAATLFSVTESVDFKITGEGAVNLDGELFRTASGKAPAVTVEGTAKTAGIKVNHTGSASMYVTYTYEGNYTYKNVDIFTTSTGVNKTATYDAFLHNHPNANANATYVTLDGVEFRAPNALSRNPGVFIVGLSGKNSLLTVKNSGLYTTASGVQLAYAIGDTKETEIAVFENSTLSCNNTAYSSSSG